MPDWTDTLDLRQSGHAAGFLAANIPLEDQDEALGGALIETKVAKKDHAEAKPATAASGK